MCGIIGYIGRKDPRDILLDGLLRLEYRGYDSAGIAVREPTGIEIFRAEGRIQNLIDRLGDRHFQGTVGLGHTRWATHGAPTEVNAHPHRGGAVTLVHNGIIENYQDLKEQVLATGRQLSSDTDTEIVAHLFDIEVEKGLTLEQCYPKVLPRLRGTYAFVILSERDPDVLLAVRGGAPLLIGLGEGENFVASDVQAVLAHTKRIVYLKDHQAAVVRRDRAEVHALDGKPVAFEVKNIAWTPDQMEKSGYRHYMLKEIHEQPTALSQTIETHIDHKRGTVRIAELEAIHDRLQRVQRISLVACGTARHAGLIGKYYLERFARIPVDVDFGSEFRYRDPIVGPDTLVVTISQSGETADTLAALREGLAKDALTLAICNVRESTLAREAGHVFYTNAGPEIGVASTKAFTTQLAALYMLALDIAQRRRTLTEAQCVELANDLLKLPILVERALESESAIEQIAKDHQQFDFFFFMGRDLHYPIALEGALKLKEISYAHTEGYAAGELKHGPIALVDRQTSVVVLALRDTPSTALPAKFNEISETLIEKTMSNLQEIKSRGGKLLTVCTEGDAAFVRESNFTIPVPPAPWALNPILASVPLQLFAYYMALERGTDVDKPRNLAKSVTVE